MTLTPTDQQQAIIDTTSSGDDVVIQAGAGAGKTSTLRMIAAHKPKQRCMYLAFNSAIAKEAQRSFGVNVRASTAHSLAYRQIGYRYRERLSGPRTPIHTAASYLNIAVQPIPTTAGTNRLFPTGALYSMVMRTITAYCQTADENITAAHVPVIAGLDELGSDGQPVAGPHHQLLADYIVPRAVRAWKDLLEPTGHAITFNHSHYLKMWQLTHPIIDADVLMIDEAQDLNPILQSVVHRQTHLQRIIVGDGNQAIYGFTGAVDSMADFAASGTTVLPLSESFRFGPAIADAANQVLSQLHSPMRISGTPRIRSQVTTLDQPSTPRANAVLCRTNAGALRELITAQFAGRRASLAGSIDDVTRFVDAADELLTRGSTNHPELVAFSSWAQVQEYVELDPSGSDLSVLVQLIDEYGVDRLRSVLSACVSADRADVIVSTAHKSKGLEWAHVRIADDFDLDRDSQRPPSREELMLAYVALTRAQLVLDPGRLGTYLYPPAIAAKAG